MIAYQGYFWLKFGIWVPMPVVRTIQALGIDIRGWEASIEWIWVTKLVDWLLNVATSGCLFILGVGVFWGAVIIDALE